MTEGEGLSMENKVISFRLDQGDIHLLAAVSVIRETSRSEVIRKALREEVNRVLKEETVEGRTKDGAGKS